MNDTLFDTDDNEQDQELLDAIAAAFGEDALASFADSAESPDTPLVDLEQAVRQIDSTTQSHSLDPRSIDISEQTLTLVAFQLGETTYGMPMHHVTEIQRVPAITHLPHLPDWVLGVTNLRGNIVSIVDLRMLLGLEPTDPVIGSRRLVVIQSLVDEIDTSLIVDRVIGIRTVPQRLVVTPTAPVDEQIGRYLAGVVDHENRLIVLLDPEKLLLSEEFRQFSHT